MNKEFGEILTGIKRAIDLLLSQIEGLFQDFLQQSSRIT